MWIWQQPKWSSFSWSSNLLITPLAAARFEQGRTLGQLAQLGFDAGREASIQALIDEAISSAAIEGETLTRASVRASVARHLHVDVPGTASVDRQADGVVAMLLDATQAHTRPLSKGQLKTWQRGLFPDGLSDMVPISVGQWRVADKDPMQIVSGPMSRSRVHYEAPPAAQVESDMHTFCEWFNKDQPLDGVLRAAIAHLWFESIHPFADGNGRVGRAIADRALMQAEGGAQRFYGLSQQILNQRSDYYAALQQATTTSLDITEWLLWFIDCLRRALQGVTTTVEVLLRRSRFWTAHDKSTFNARQRHVLDRVLGEFEGKLTAKKWAAMQKCSVQTAQRDIQDLVKRGVIEQDPGGGKRTSYTVLEPSRSI